MISTTNIHRYLIDFSMNMVKSHLLNRTTLSSAIIGVVPKEVGTRNNDEDRTNMHPVGTAGIVIQVTGTNWPRPAYTLLVTGLCRFRLESLAQESPYLIGTVRQLDKLSDEDLSKFNWEKSYCFCEEEESFEASLYSFFQLLAEYERNNDNEAKLEKLPLIRWISFLQESSSVFHPSWDY